MKFWICCAAMLGASLGFAQQNDPSAPQPSSQGQVLFSGQPTQGDKSAATATATPVTDAERKSVAIAAWNLDVHLSPREQAMEVHTRVTLRNAGATPLSRIALQLSSTLHFEVVGLHSKKLAFTQHSLASDADHTGKLDEAVIPLAEPLAPGAAMTLDVDYGGTVPLTAERLTAIGAPQATAEASDWDRITENFIGVRGFGNVVWYPVSSVPVSLKDGAKLFAEIGRQKQMDEDATVSLRVTDEFVSPVPNAVLLNGHLMDGVQPVAMPTASFPGVMTAVLPATRLGFETPSFFVARRSVVEGHGLRVLATEADAGSAQRYIAAAELAEPLVTTWLGKAEDRPSRFSICRRRTMLRQRRARCWRRRFPADDAEHLAPVAVHALAHGAFQSPRPWLNEGVAAFLGSLWIEQSDGTAGGAGEPERWPSCAGAGRAGIARRGSGRRSAARDERGLLPDESGVRALDAARRGGGQGAPERSAGL